MAAGSGRVVVVGAGHNGLVAAAYLAKAGLRVSLLERRDRTGGVMALAQTVGRLRSSVVKDLRLGEHGLRSIRPEVRVFAPQPGGGSVTLWSDPRRTAEELWRLSARDADAYPEFDQKVRALASFVAHLNATTPPDLKAPSLPDALGGLKLVRAFRGLGKRPGRELLRVLPMAVADFLGETFEGDAIRAAIAVRGVRFTAMGPWSAGTTAVLLADSAGNDGGAAGQSTFAVGGPQAVAKAMAAAARSAGVDIRTGAEVAAVTIRRGRATGVALASGEEIEADVVVSGLDPKRTLLGLVDPAVLGPSLRWRAGNIRTPGTVANVDLVLDGLPRFTDADPDGPRLTGRIVLAPGIDHIERAFDDSKYGRTSTEPLLEATIPTLSDPALATEGRHHMHVLVQYAPYNRSEGDWSADRDALGDLVLKTLETYAPGIGDMVVDRRVTTPLDLETEFGITEGHALHGEPGLDQMFAWRPLLGHARYRMPVEGLYLCGSGAHPGGGVTGAPGANAAREVLLDLKRR